MYCPAPFLRPQPAVAVGAGFVVAQLCAQGHLQVNAVGSGQVSHTDQDVGQLYGKPFGLQAAMFAPFEPDLSKISTVPVLLPRLGHFSVDVRQHCAYISLAFPPALLLSGLMSTLNKLPDRHSDCPPHRMSL